MEELKKKIMADKNPQDSFLFWKTGFVGIVLVLCGIFFLLMNFRIIPESGDLNNRVLGVLLFITGIVFTFFQGGGGGLFWFLIPAGVSFTVGIITLIVGIDQLFSIVNLGFFCLGLAVTFLLIFLLRKTAWWALLPAGALAGICAWIMLALVQPAIGFHPPALIFFVGLSFLSVYFFSVQKHKMRFALFTGLIIVTAAMLYYFIVIFYVFTLFWAILLVAAGIVFPFAILFFEKRAKRHEYFEKPQA
ncbi:MAG: hypothetical protein JXD23_14795 [Spirochaetales bacterium]|nr:hypothetical protein [Spirochaetales bacterium]